jgi:cytoskeletal protein RodZ
MASLHEVGQALKEAREAQGRTQEEIAETTRIATRHIRAIEEGNEKELPEVFYIRSFLKKYADAVGLSANEVADAYSKAPVPTTTTPSLGMTLGPIVYYIAVIGLIGGVLALAWHFQPKVSVVSEPSPTPTPSLKPSPKPTVAVYGPPVKPTPKPSPSVAATSPAPAAVASVVPSSASPQASPTASAAPVGAASPAAGATPAPSPTPSTGRLELVIQERSWVEVRANGRLVFEGLMRPGQRRTVNGETIEVTAGNAGGVRIFINGADSGVLGDRGMVVTKTFNP